MKQVVERSRGKWMPVRQEVDVEGKLDCIRSNQENLFFKAIIYGYVMRG